MSTAVEFSESCFLHGISFSSLSSLQVWSGNSVRSEVGTFCFMSVIWMGKTINLRPVFQLFSSVNLRYFASDARIVKLYAVVAE